MGEHDYYKRLVEILKQNGCYPTRTGKGSHERWFNPKNNHTQELKKLSSTV